MYVQAERTTLLLRAISGKAELLSYRLIQRPRAAVTDSCPRSAEREAKSSMTVSPSRAQRKSEPYSQKVAGELDNAAQTSTGQNRRWTHSSKSGRVWNYASDTYFNQWAHQQVASNPEWTLHTRHCKKGREIHGLPVKFSVKSTGSPPGSPGMSPPPSLRNSVMWGKALMFSISISLSVKSH